MATGAESSGHRVVYTGQTFPKTSGAINAKYQRHAELEFRNRRRSLPIAGSKAGTRRASCAAISGSVFSDRFATPFLAVDAQRLAERSTSTGIPFIPSLCSPRPVTLVRSGTPRVQFYCSRRSSVTETRAREEQTAARRRTERRGRSGGREREAGFQMDINSSACSTPRSSLITPLQLLSLIKASGPAGA